MSSIAWIVTIIVIVVVVALAVGAWYGMRRRALRQRFGPEYDRAVSEQDNRSAAERELRARERRHAELRLRPLSAEARGTYVAAWEEVQARFVDNPREAVAAGDQLVTRLVAECGYPTKDYDEQLAQLSVEHAQTLGHYRDAHEIYLRDQRGEADTEELRQALVHYRELFADLLGYHDVGQPRTDRDEPVPAEAAADPESRTQADRGANSDATR